MVNINMLKGKIIENGLTVEKLANKLGINKSTLYRKFSQDGGNISIKEAYLIAKELNLTSEESMSIFFA